MDIPEFLQPLFCAEVFGLFQYFAITNNIEANNLVHIHIYVVGDVSSW